MEQRDIVRATGIVMAAFVTSRVLGLAREIIIGHQFGTSRELDAYLAAFRVPDFIFQLVAGGALASAFIPTFTTYLARGDQREAWRVASGVFNLLLVVLCLLAMSAALAAPWLVATIVAPGFAPAEQALTADLMRLMLISSVVFGLSGLVMGVLNSLQHFLLPALAPLVYNLSIIGGAIFLAPTVGVHGLAIGVVVGAALHLAIQVPILVRKGLAYAPTFALDHPGVHEVGRLLGPRALGLAAVQINFLVNTFLASGLPAGSLAALNYAWLLMLMPQGIFAMAVATTAFPTFAALVARNELAAMRRALTSTLRLTLYLTLPAAVGLYVLRVPLVELLLQRGAFTSASTIATAWALQFYAIGLFAHATVEIVARAFYALHDTKTPVFVGLGAMGLNIVLSLALLGPLAHGGLALANSIATILEMLALLALLRTRLGGLEARQLLAALARMSAATGVMGVSLAAYARGFDGAPNLLLVGGAILMGAAVYLVTTRVLGSDEIAVLRRGLARSE